MLKQYKENMKIAEDKDAKLVIMLKLTLLLNLRSKYEVIGGCVWHFYPGNDLIRSDAEKYFQHRTDVKNVVRLKYFPSWQ